MVSKELLNLFCWMIKYNKSEYQDAACMVNIFKCFWVIRKNEELSVEVLRILEVSSSGRDARETSNKEVKISNQLIEIQMKKELEKHISKFAKYVQTLILSDNKEGGRRESFATDLQKISPQKIKLALAVLISLSPKKSFLPVIFNPLISSLGSLLTSSSLENNLKALTVIASLEPTIFHTGNSNYVKIKDFIFDLLQSKFSLQTQEKQRNGFDIASSTNKNELKARASAECRVIVIGLKLLTALQYRSSLKTSKNQSLDDSTSSSCTQTSASSANSNMSNSQTFPEKEHLSDLDEEIIDLLFETIEDGGELPSEQHFNTREKAYIRLVAANMILKLITTFPTATSKYMSTERWHMLGFMCIDADSTVRSIFMRKILRALYGNYGFYLKGTKSQVNGRSRVLLPLKYISYLCLAGDDEDESLKKEISQKLFAYVRHLRVKNESLQVHSDDRSMINPNMPENILPYVIHLLSNHPDFPDVGFMGKDGKINSEENENEDGTAKEQEKDNYKTTNRDPIKTKKQNITNSTYYQKGRPRPITKHDNAKLKEISKYIHFILDPIINTLADADNISFLLQMVDRILSSYNNGDIKIIMVTYMVKDALQMRIKTQDNLIMYPGEIFLPKTLYKPVGASKVMKDKHNIPSKTAKELKAAAKIENDVAQTDENTNVSNLISTFVDNDKCQPQEAKKFYRKQEIAADIPSCTPVDEEALGKEENHQSLSTGESSIVGGRVLRRRK